MNIRFTCSLSPPFPLSLHVSKYTYIHMCIHIHIHTYIHMNIHTYIQIFFIYKKKGPSSSPPGRTKLAQHPKP